MSHDEEGGFRHQRWARRSVKAKIGIVLAAIIFVPGFLALFGAVTMWLWNWLMPTIFKLPAIGFWQAVGILFLSHLLFKGGLAGRAGRSSWKKARIRRQMEERGPEASPE